MSEWARDNADPEQLLARVRRWTVFFIVGLVISGATALAIPTQLRAAVRLLGEDLRASGVIPEHVAAWLQTLRDGIRATEAQAPFMFYGTDWLAFGHFAIALAFVGALRDPLRNRWLFRFGMLVCAFVPMWLCDRWIRVIEGTGSRASPHMPFGV